MITNFDKNVINDEMIGIVAVSHGTIAQGALNSAGVVMGCGDLENAFYLCLESSDDPFEYGNKLEEIMNSFAKGCIVLCDIPNGTPYRQLLMVSRKANKTPCAVAGLNITMAIVAASARTYEENPAEIAKMIISEANQSIVNVTEEYEKMVSKKAE